jgi:hypothetical protein
MISWLMTEVTAAGAADTWLSRGILSDDPGST